MNPRIFTLVFLLGLLETQVLAEVPACAKIFGPTLVRGDVYVDKSEEHVFYIEQEHPTSERPFSFRAIYDQARKTIDINIHLVDRDNHLRSEIRGKQAYDQMMEHFAGHDVRVIYGNWSYSDNSRTYLHNKHHLNMTPEEAALNTWSGQQAKKYGFENVRILLDDFVEYTDDRRYVIQVEFHKGEIPTGWQRLRDFFRF